MAGLAAAAAQDLISASLPGWNLSLALHTLYHGRADWEDRARIRGVTQQIHRLQRASRAGHH